MSEKKSKAIDVPIEETWKYQLELWQKSDGRKIITNEFIDLIHSLNRKDINDFCEVLSTPHSEKNLMTFFDDPASTKFHGSELGGLAKHSLDVYKVFRKMNDDYHLNQSKETMIICGLFHDLCKWDLYKPCINLNGTVSKKADFKFEDANFMGHGEESVIKLQQYIKLTPEQQLIIRWHMGPYDFGWKYAQKNVEKISGIPMWFFIADYTAAKAAGLENESSDE